MEGVKTIITLLGDLATFSWLLLRPQSALAAENLFLRKQLAMFQERKAKPRRPDTPIRIALCYFPGYSTDVTHWSLSSPGHSFDGTVRAFAYSGAVNHDQSAHQYPRNSDS